MIQPHMFKLGSEEESDPEEEPEFKLHTPILHLILPLFTFKVQNLNINEDVVMFFWTSLTRSLLYKAMVRGSPLKRASSTAV